MNRAELRMLLRDQEQMLDDLRKDLQELEGIQKRMNEATSSPGFSAQDILRTMREMLDYMLRGKEQAIRLLTDHLRKMREMGEG